MRMPSLSGLRALLAARRRPLLLAALVLALLYLWTASCGLPLGLGEAHDNHYNLLSQAFLHGQLHLLEAPRPELFELADPYDPGRNGQFRFHDASLFRGRYYLYFGVVPAVVAFVPWRALGLGDLPEPLAAWSFGLGAFVFAALSLRRLVREHLAVPPTGAFLAYLLLGLTNVVLFMLRSPHVYEVAITAGLCFGSAAAFVLLGAGESPHLGRFALAGLLLGLAVGSRPNLLVLVPLLPLLAWPPAAGRGGRQVLRPVLAFAAALLPCLFLLGLYNYARFSSWTEFGTSYQLLGMHRISRFDPRFVWPTLHYLFLAPPDLRLDFPFVFPFHEWPFAHLAGDSYFLDQQTTGVLFHSPFVLLLLAAPLVLRGAPLREQGLLVRRLAVLVGCGLALPLATSYAFASVAMRFEADFLTYLAVPALFLWLTLAAKVPPARRRLFRSCAAAVFAWSALVALPESLTGASDDLRRQNPALFAALERSVEPLRVAAGRVLDRDGRTRVRLRVAFPERLSAEEEPFLSWGTVDAYDALWLREPAMGVFRFRLDSAASRGAAPARSAVSGVLPLGAGAFHDVVLDIDRVRHRIRATIDGASAFELKDTLVAPGSNRIWPGRGPRGHGALDLGQFSGVLVPEAMQIAGPPGLESLPSLLPAAAAVVATREALPAGAAAGRLALVSGRGGVYLATGGGWRWLPRAYVDRVGVERPWLPAAMREGESLPLLVSGDSPAADAILLRRLADGRFACSAARWDGQRWSFGAPGPSFPAPAAAARMVVTLDRPARLASASLDGREVLHATVELGPIPTGHVLIGQLPAGVGALTAR